MIICRYITKELCATLLATSVVLLLIFMSNQFVHYLRSAANGNMSAHMVMWLLWLRMPILLGVLLPLSLFLTILLVYGRMYADNEMMVLFASGVSRAKLYKITMNFAVFITIIVAVLSLWLGPYLDRYAARIIKQGALSPLELVQPGRFQSFKDGKWLLYVDKKSKNNKRLYNIFVADQERRGGVISAAKGYLQLDKKTGDTFFVFNQGNRYEGEPGRRDYQIINFAKYGARLTRSDDTAIDKVNAIPTLALFKNHKNNLRMAELQWRISIPIMAILLGLMAVPLSRVKTRRNRYAQLIPAILLYVIYGNFMFVGRAWIQTGVVSHLTGMWWVHVTMALIAAGLIINQIGWRRPFRGNYLT